MPSIQDIADAPLFRLEDVFGNLSDSFRGLRTADGIRTSDGRTLDAVAFDNSAWRCDDAGDALVPVGEALATQALALKRAQGNGSEGVHAHLADLSLMRAALGPAVPPDGSRDLHLHDVVTSGLKDPVLPQRDLDRAAVERAEARLAEGEGDGFHAEAFEMHPVDVETPDRVLARIQQDTGISADRWHDVAEYPTYMIEPIRAMAREMLRPILGNAAVLEDLRRLEIPKGEVERFNAVKRWAKTTGDERTLPPFSHRSMPGYKTSEATLAEVNGVTMLIFSDFHAHYAYAWQTDPDVTPKLKGDAEPNAPRF